MDALQVRARGAGRLRLGRPRRLRGGGAVARALRRAGLSFNSYNIQNIALAMTPDTPRNEHSLWYQYYFHSERGRRGLAQDRRGICRLLWQLWSPTWRFDDATFERSAAAFDNPDFVDVVIHSYRHRFGLVPGDPALADVEAALALQPAITVPALTFDGADDGVRPPAAAVAARAPLHRPAHALRWCPAWATTCRRRCRGCLPMACCRWSTAPGPAGWADFMSRPVLRPIVQEADRWPDRPAPRTQHPRASTRPVHDSWRPPDGQLLDPVRGIHFAAGSQLARLRRQVLRHQHLAVRTPLDLRDARLQRLEPAPFQLVGARRGARVEHQRCAQVGQQL